MIQYLIPRTDGEWFSLHATQFGDALRPLSFASERAQGWGEWRIRCEGVEISFSLEDPGIHVCFEGDLPQETADQIVQEIRQNVERVTRQKGRIVPL